MRKFVVPTLLAIAIALPAFAQDGSEAGEAAAAASDGGDVATVQNVDEAQTSGEEGLVKLKLEADNWVAVYRSGVVVERMPLVDDGSCKVGDGQIGKAKFCGSAST